MVKKRKSKTPYPKMPKKTEKQLIAIDGANQVFGNIAVVGSKK